MTNLMNSGKPKAWQEAGFMRGSEAICPNWDDHEFNEGYYGYECTRCGLFYAFGCAPWEDNE
jgi:hypothetical protein